MNIPHHTLAQESLMIYSDGSCLGNPGPGGWAFIVLEKKLSAWSELTHASGSEEYTTNNRMEMMAGLEALKWLEKRKIANCLIKTDSQYLCHGLQQWLENWKKRKWKTAQGQSVKNQDLWQEIDILQNRLSPRWEWVKGHSTDPWNQKVDQIARKAALEPSYSKREDYD